MAIVEMPAQKKARELAALKAQNELKYNAKAKAGSFGTNAKQGGMTHEQELAKYGYIVGGWTVTGTLPLGYGGTVEYGLVETNKNYVQRFSTIYYTSTAAAGVGFNRFLVFNKNNNKTTFSDFKGITLGGSVNYAEFSGTYANSSTYHSIGAGVGFGLSFKIFGSGSAGYTTLLGKPTYSPPVDISTWRPHPYEVGL